MSRRSLVTVLVLLTAGAGLWACGGEDADQPSEPGSQVATVDMEPDSALLTEAGESRTLEAVARDADGDPVAGVEFTWSSSSEAVAEVNSSGDVTAVSDGRAWIRATVQGFSDSANVRVATVDEQFGDVMGSATGDLAVAADWASHLRPQSDAWTFLESRLGASLLAADEVVLIEGVEVSGISHRFVLLVRDGNRLRAATNVEPGSPLIGEVRVDTSAITSQVEDYLDFVSAAEPEEGVGGNVSVKDGTAYLFTWAGPEESRQFMLYGATFDEFSREDVPGSEPDRTRYQVLARGWDLWASLF